MGKGFFVWSGKNEEDNKKMIKKKKQHSVRMKRFVSWSIINLFLIMSIRLKSHVLQAVVLVFGCIVISIMFRFYNKNVIAKCLIKTLFVMATIFLGTGILNISIFIGLHFGSGEEQGIYNCSNFFQNKNVLIIVPHEDDEINLVGGILNQYIDAGSMVRVVFATNGDKVYKGSRRNVEAIEALQVVEIEEGNIIFLGFGDTWKPQPLGGMCIEHIYDSGDGTVQWTSYAGNTETYALNKPYREHFYTRNAWVEDICKIILEYKPDVIYVNDFDTHPDHRACGLFFDEAMGKILALGEGYYPTIYKGYCYGTGWSAGDDYVCEKVKLTGNILSTMEPADIYGYSWDNRIRLPLCSEDVTGLISNSKVYAMLARHVSQDAVLKAGEIINGDKVFWERRTDSILYNASIMINGQQSNILNDFKIFDCNNVTDRSAQPYDGVVNLEPYSEKVIEVILPKESDIREIYLYDNPDVSSNILGGYVEFNTGELIEYSQLNNNGAATIVECNVKDVKSFKVIITKWEGKFCGFTEIEAYDREQLNRDYIIKWQDMQGDFAYSYWIEEGKTDAEFSVYSNRENNEYSVSIEGDGCSFRITDGKYVVSCPKGRACQLIVRTRDGIADTIIVSNPTHLQREITNYQKLYDYCMATYKNWFMKQINYYFKIVFNKCYYR